MIFRVIFKVSFYEVWKDFTTLFDAANYAAEIRGTVFDKDDKACPIKRLRIEFIEPEEEKAAPTSADQ
jgi:hypothetical protein